MNKRKCNVIATVLLTLVISVSGCLTAFAEEPPSTAGGNLTDTITWSISGDVLTISGTGVMPSYEYTSPPWRKYSFSRAVIEDGITSIGEGAFGYCSSLTSVTIPKSVTSIGEEAFYDCSSLESVTILGSVTSIGDETFWQCSRLTSVNIPDSVTSIGYMAFSHCSSLTSIKIPESVTEIGENAFMLCSSLTSINIPKNVTSIERGAFSSCSSLTSIEIPENVTSIGDGAFSHCSSLTSVTLPEILGRIGHSAFFDCSSLTSVNIPESVTSIEASAFCACSSLRSINIPKSVTSIGNYTFRDCSSLESITMPETVTSIGVQAFYSCSSLTSIKIPEYVTSIDNSAFSKCTSLKTVEYACNSKYSVESQRPSLGLDGLVWSAKHYDLTHHDEVPATCTNPGIKEYYKCANCSKNFADEACTAELSADDLVIPLASHTLVLRDEIAATWTKVGLIKHWECNECGKFFADEDGKKELSEDELANRIVAHGDCGRDGDPVHWALDMDGKLTISGSGKMKNYRGSNPPWNQYKDYIRYIEIEEGVTHIGEYAFCNHIVLESVELQEGLEEIGNYAFKGCLSLKRIVIPESVRDIGGGAFDECSSLKRVEITDVEKYIKINCNGGGPTSNGADLFINGELVKEITIPNGTKYMSAILEGCKSIKRINIPDSLEEVAYSWISDTNNVELNYSSIECFLALHIKGSYSESPYYIGGTKLLINGEEATKVEIPETVSRIMLYKFAGINNIKEIILPDSLEAIGHSAFSSCTSLESIVIPKNVTSIGTYAFNGCTKLKSVKFETTALKEIPDWCFIGCEELESVSLSTGIVSIGDYALFSCKFKTLIIPDGVVVIRNKISSSLRSVVLPASIKAITGDPLNPDINSIAVYKDSYAEEWCKQNGYGSKLVYLDQEEETAAYFYQKTDQKNMVVGDSFGLKDLFFSTDELMNTDFVVSDYDEKVVSVDNGIITAIKAGSTDLKVVCNEEEYIVKVKVLESADESDPTLIKLSTSELSLGRGDTAYLKTSYEPDSVAEPELEWTSSNQDVVTVDNGLVNANGIGTAKITVSLKSNSEVKRTCNVTVNAPLKKILTYDEVFGDEDYYTVTKNTSMKLEYTVDPLDTTDDLTASFSSSDDSIVTVDEYGYMHAVENGIAEVTIKIGELIKTVQVKVVNPLKGVTLKETEISIRGADTKQLELVTDPLDTSDKITRVEWRSASPSIASVDQNGLVTAHQAGNTTVFVRVFINDETSTSYYLSCPVNVTSTPLQGIEIKDKDKYRVEYGESFLPEINYNPTNTTDSRTVVWSSSDESVVKKDWDGKFKAVGLGTATLTATVGEFTDTVEVTVEKATPSITVPSNLETTCETSLGEIPLTEGFEWNEIKSVGGAGAKTFTATYTPSNTDLYKVVSDVEVPVTVKHAFGTEMYSNDSEHWNVCLCGAKGNVNEHDWFADYRVDKEPSCTEDGSKSIYCKVCDTVKKDSQVKVDKLGHKYAEEIVLPTCVQKGYTMHICAACGDKYNDTEVDATGHSFGEWKEVDASNCTKEGVQQRVCTACGTTESKGLSKKNHDFNSEYTIDKAATCTTDGSESRHCKNCDAVTDSRAIAAVGHKYSNWETTTEPTCTTKGEAERICSECKDKETIELSARSHDWKEEYTIEKEATCTEKGRKSIHCRDCDALKPDSEKEIEATGHKYGNWITMTEPTCDTAGKAERVCSDCGAKDTKNLEALNHNYADAIVPPTCVQKGYIMHVCVACGDKYNDTEVDATGHSFGEWAEVDASSCTEEGVQQRVCTACGTTESKGLSKRDHDFGSEYTIDKAATCTSDGSESRHCKNCDAVTDSRAIAAVGHKYSDWKTTTDPTCTTKGEAERICSECNSKETIELPARSHDWKEEYTVEKEPTCTEKGRKSIHCRDCDALKPDSEKETAALGHDWKQIDALAATTSNDGYSSHTKCEACGLIDGRTDVPRIDADSITLEKSLYEFDGTAKTPSVSVKDITDKLLVENIDYKIIYANNTNAGTAIVTIKFEGKYSGSIDRTFEIKDKEASGEGSSGGGSSSGDAGGGSSGGSSGGDIGGGSIGGGGAGGGGGGIAPPEPEDNTITNTGSESAGDASTSVDVKDNTTVTEGRTETKVDADLGSKIVENAVENKSTDIVIKAETAQGNSSASTVALPASTIKDISDKTEASITIKTDSAEVSFDKTALDAVAAKAGTVGDVRLVVEIKEHNKNKVVIELKLETSNGAASDFKGGNATVTVPVSKELAGKKIVCVYIDDNGKYIKIGGSLSADKKSFTFTTGHFSTYAILEEAEADAVIDEQNKAEAPAVKVAKASVKLKAYKGGKLKVTASAKNATGYRVYYKKSTWKKYKTYTKGNIKTLNKTFKKLAKGKYTVKVKAFHKADDGKTTWGADSSIKKITVR